MICTETGEQVTVYAGEEKIAPAFSDLANDLIRKTGR